MSLIYVVNRKKYLYFVDMFFFITIVKSHISNI